MEIPSAFYSSVAGAGCKGTELEWTSGSTGRIRFVMLEMNLAIGIANRWSCKRILSCLKLSGTQQKSGTKAWTSARQDASHCELHPSPSGQGVNFVLDAWTAKRHNHHFRGTGARYLSFHLSRSTGTASPWLENIIMDVKALRCAWITRVYHTGHEPNVTTSTRSGKSNFWQRYPWLWNFHSQGLIYGTPDMHFRVYREGLS